MKGNCENVICQICQQEMSFGRIKPHIKARHKEITVKEYVDKFWDTLPLHKLCEVCNINIVYKYQTCSKKCQSHKASKERKGVPRGFMSIETKNKISKSMKGKKGGFSGHKHSDKVKLIQSLNVIKNKPHRGFKHSLETKLIQSQKRKEYILNNREKFWKSFIQNKPNKLETFVSYILDKNNIKYDFQFFINKNGVCKSYDFKIKESNILLEIDGDYWHGNPKLDKHFYKLNEVKRNDLLKDELAKDNGFTLLRFWESDIYDNPDTIINKIKQYL